MVKSKFKFNPETLSFEKQTISIARFIYTKILPHFASSLVLGISLGVCATYYVGSPAEREAKSENIELKTKFELLNSQLKNFQSDLATIQNNDDNVYRAIFEAKPVAASVRNAGFGGVDLYDNLRGYENSALMIETAFKLDVISKQMIVQSHSYDEVVDMVKNKENMLACIPSIQPISIKDLSHFGSPFGYRYHPILHFTRLHAGVDLCADKGKNIYATGNGVVVQAEYNPGGYGNYVRINHGYGYTTVYGHMSKILVHEGQKVNRGDIIGLVGSTGLSTSSHLHYEVRINNQPVNPVNFYQNGMSEDEYQTLLKSSTEETHIYE